MDDGRWTVWSMAAAKAHESGARTRIRFGILARADILQVPRWAVSCDYVQHTHTRTHAREQ